MKLTVVISFVVQLAFVASVPALSRNLGVGKGGSKSKGSKATSNGKGKGKGGWGWGWTSPTSSKMGCKSSKSSKMVCKKKKKKMKKKKKKMMIKKKMTMHPTPAPHKVKPPSEDIKMTPTVAPTPRPVKQPSVTPTPRPVGTPEQGYCADAVKYETNGHKYLMGGYANEWGTADATAANLTCCGQPGHLATISDSGENTFIAVNIASPTQAPCWIGLHSTVSIWGIFTNEDFQWSNGEEYNWQKYNNFVDKKPTPFYPATTVGPEVSILPNGYWQNQQAGTDWCFAVEFNCI
jgi:hypothetical protein